MVFDKCGVEVIEVKKSEGRGRLNQHSTVYNMQEQSSRPMVSNDMNEFMGTLRTRGYRHNQEQKLFLVDFMEAHPEFAFGRYVGPRQKAQALWVQLTDEMNARGPKKTVAQWQKAWTDVKSRARVRVITKASNPNFDPVNDLDARVLALLDSISENPSNSTTATTNATEYGACDSGMNETHAHNQSDFLHSLEGELLPPEMVLLPETETGPDSVESCSIADVKQVLTPEGDDNDTDLHDGHLDNARLGGRNNIYDDIRENFDQNGSYSDAIDTGQNYDEGSASSTKYTRQNYQRHNINTYRNRWRRLANRNVSIRANTSPSVSNFQRRQAETLEAISKAMLQNAENEKERNELMSKNLEINRARLKADLERNVLLRDLVTTLKGISQDKNQRLPY